LYIKAACSILTYSFYLRLFGEKEEKKPYTWHPFPPLLLGWDCSWECCSLGTVAQLLPPPTATKESNECIFRGGLPAVKCGRKSDNDRSSVPARNRECDGAFAAHKCQQRNKGNPPFLYSGGSNTQHFVEGVRAAQAGRPAAGPQSSFLPFPGTLL
jgi:hypothetical protein